MFIFFQLTVNILEFSHAQTFSSGTNKQGFK